jgi:site-specific DNA recombinase
MSGIGAIYARSSTSKQGDTVDHQVAMIKEFAKRMNMKVQFSDKFIYEDEQSGYKTTLIQRPSMRRMISDIDNGLINVVFFKGISRFARDSGESITTAKRLLQKGVRVISLEENYDSDKSDPTMFQIYSVMAEQESRKTGVRVSLGNKQKARNGLWVGSATPYGYIKVKNIQNETTKMNALESGLKSDSLFPSDEEKVVVEKIFNLFVEEGLGRKRIASLLNDSGYRTRKGYVFSDKRVKDILNNPSYVGDIVYGKTRYEYIEHETERRKIQSTIHQTEDEWSICRDAHPPIIPRELFLEAQKIIKKKETKYNQPARFNAAKHPLTGLLVCSRCGKPMICQKRTNKDKQGNKKEYRYYVCSTYHTKGRHICPQANVNADDLEDFIHSYIQNKISKFENETSIIVSTSNKNDNKDKIVREMEVIEEKLKKKVKATGSLLENIEMYDADTFKQLNMNLKEEIEELRHSKGKLQFQLEQITDDYNPEELKFLMEDFKKMDSKSISDKREKFHNWIDKVFITDSEVDEIKVNIL